MSKERLLNVARSLRECTLDRSFFTMKKWGHEASWVRSMLGKVSSKPTCGTPACAMGHYAVRDDLQDTFTLDETGGLRVRGRRPNFEVIGNHFGISYEETNELFSEYGCGNAQTREEAARYIEEFAEAKWPTPPPPAPVIEAVKPVEVKKVEEREIQYF